MTRPNSSILFIYRDEWIRLTVHFTFILGNLYIHGYETKRGQPEASMLNSVFTHEINISKANIINLCNALNLKSTSQDGIFKTLKERFSGNNGLYLLSDFLKDHGVKFREYINDNSRD